MVTSFDNGLVSSNICHRRQRIKYLQTRIRGGRDKEETIYLSTRNSGNGIHSKEVPFSFSDNINSSLILSRIDEANKGALLFYNGRFMLSQFAILLGQSHFQDDVFAFVKLLLQRAAIYMTFGERYRTAMPLLLLLNSLQRPHTHYRGIALPHLSLVRVV